MTKYGSDSGEYVVFAHGDYSNQDISVIRIDGQKVYINPVEIDAENCLVRLEACREGAAILLENHDGDYRLYKLM